MSKRNNENTMTKFNLINLHQSKIDKQKLNNLRGGNFTEMEDLPAEGCGDHCQGCGDASNKKTVRKRM